MRSIRGALRREPEYAREYRAQKKQVAQERESERVRMIKREARRDAINDSKTRAERAADIAKGIKTAAYGVEKKKAAFYGNVGPSLRVRSDALSRIKRLGR